MTIVGWLCHDVERRSSRSGDYFRHSFDGLPVGKHSQQRLGTASVCVSVHVQVLKEACETRPEHGR